MLFFFFVCVCFLPVVRLSKHAVFRLSHTIHHFTLRISLMLLLLLLLLLAVVFLCLFQFHVPRFTSGPEYYRTSPQIRIIALASTDDNDMLDDFSVGLSES